MNKIRSVRDWVLVLINFEWIAQPDSEALLACHHNHAKRTQSELKYIYNTTHLYLRQSVQP